VEFNSQTKRFIARF